MLKDAHLLKADNPLSDILKLAESKLTENQKDVARERAGVLVDFEERARKNREWMEKVHDHRDAGLKLRGCSSCKALWENPHRGYVDSQIQAFIDKDKL